MGYKEDAIKGISWTGLLSFLTKAVGFVEAIILTRLLIPSQFGAYGVALLALGLLEVITESGVNIILVQEKHSDEYINSAWIVSILRGMLIMLILFVSAPFISSFFNSTESRLLLYIVSFVPLIRGFINPSVVKMQKELRFAQNFWYRAAILFVDTCVSIIVTYITKSPIGIVTGLLAGVFTELIFSFIFISPRPSFNFSNSYIKKIINRGKWITASSIFDYLFHNADNIAVGRLLGSSSLGIYQLAYSLSAIPLSEIGRVFVHVTVPIMVNISDDSKRLKSAFIKSVISITIITLPFAFVFAVFPNLVLIILGEKWAAVAIVLPILAVLGFIKSVSISTTALFISLKKQEYVTIITLINILGLTVSIIPLIMSYGIFGAGLSALIGSICAVPFILYFTRKSFFELETKKND